MAKYEILAIVNGKLGETEAEKVLADSLKLINKSKNFKETKLGLKNLAYVIAGHDKGWYIQYNFESDDTAAINEFSRVTKLNKDVIRFLVINLDKDYGANALNNPNKVKKAKAKKDAYDKRIERIRAEKAAIEEANAKLEEINKISEAK